MNEFSAPKKDGQSTRVHGSVCQVHVLSCQLVFVGFPFAGHERSRDLGQCVCFLTQTESNPGRSTEIPLRTQLLQTGANKACFRRREPHNGPLKCGIVLHCKVDNMWLPESECVIFGWAEATVLPPFKSCLANFNLRVRPFLPLPGRDTRAHPRRTPFGFQTGLPRAFLRQMGHDPRTSNEITR